MRVGLTGALHAGRPGFIGDWLTRELRAGGHDVWLMPWDVRVPWVEAPDVDVVVHLAARVGRLLCEANERDVVDTNAWGTINVARACAGAGVRLLYVSSSEAGYAGNLYGLSKRWGEDAARLVYAAHPDRLQIARLFMPYGPGHPPGHGRAALTNWVWQALTRQPLIVHARTSRSWCWVGDTARALRLLVEDWPAPPLLSFERFIGDDAPFVWNVGRTDNVCSSDFVAELCVDRYGDGDRSLIRRIPKPAGIADHKIPDVSPLLSLGWAPAVELPEGMDAVADWLREWDGDERVDDTLRLAT